jgi:hypothetical protein
MDYKEMPLEIEKNRTEQKRLDSKAFEHFVDGAVFVLIMAILTFGFIRMLELLLKKC